MLVCLNPLQAGTGSSTNPASLSYLFGQLPRGIADRILFGNRCNDIRNPSHFWDFSINSSIGSMPTTQIVDLLT